MITIQQIIYNRPENPNKHQDIIDTIKYGLMCAVGLLILNFSGIDMFQFPIKMGWGSFAIALTIAFYTGRTSKNG